MRKELEGITKYLPEGWKEAAREMGAITRAREIKTAEELLGLILLYLTSGGSLGGTATLYNLTTEGHMSKEAVSERIRKSGEWLEWMVRELCRGNGFSMERPGWLDRNVVTVDASELSVKGSKEGDYRLHCAFEIFQLSYRTLEITEIKEGEKLSRHVVRPGDIALADRVYGTIQGMEHVRAHEGDFILRYRTNSFNVYDQEGKKLDLLSEFQSLKPMEHKSVNGYYYSKGEKRPVRIVAMRKDEESIRLAQRKMIKEQRKKQKKGPSSKALDLNRYIVLATSLDYSDERILELYRARWQIEQVFYRLKELFQFGEVPSKREDSVRAWFYGKLLLAVLAQIIMIRECFSPSEQEALRAASHLQFVELFEDH